MPLPANKCHQHDYSDDIPVILAGYVGFNRFARHPGRAHPVMVARHNLAPPGNSQPAKQPIAVYNRPGVWLMIISDRFSINVRSAIFTTSSRSSSEEPHRTGDGLQDVIMVIGLGLALRHFSPNNQVRSSRSIRSDLAASGNHRRIIRSTRAFLAGRG